MRNPFTRNAKREPLYAPELAVIAKEFAARDVPFLTGGGRNHSHCWVELSDYLVLSIQTNPKIVGRGKIAEAVVLLADKSLSWKESVLSDELYERIGFGADDEHIRRFERSDKKVPRDVVELAESLLRDPFVQNFKP